MMRRPYLFLLLASCGLFVVTAALVNWVVDPFRFYHQAWFDIGFSSNQRYQNPGLARTSPHQVALIGTSHTEPFITSQMSETLGRESLNLSMSGSLVTGQSVMAEQVLQQGKVERVLWEINYPSFSLGQGVSDPGSFPWFLFRPDTETPFRYLLSWDTFQESLAGLRGERVPSLDQLHRWDLEATFGEPRVLANWDFMTARWNDDLRAFYAMYAITPDELTRLFTDEVERLVRAYPDVRFDFLLVPSTLYDYANDLQIAPGRLDKRLHLRDETARLAQRFPNAHAWDFQQDGWMVNDLSNYKDMDHFGQNIISELLDRLSEPANASDPGQILQETRDLRVRVSLFLQRYCVQQPDRCQESLLENLAALRTGDTAPESR